MENKITIDKVVENYNELVQRAIDFAYIVRDTDLQKTVIDELISQIRYMRGYKIQAKERGDEEAANSFFHMQCMLNSIQSYLKMLLEIKRKKYHNAWNLLIDAQEYSSYAIRVGAGSHGVDNYQSMLIDAEKVLFPNFTVYQSAGFIMRGGKCSICGEKLEFCDHIEENIYFGRVCKRIEISDVDIDHFALVKNPEDKRCIPTEFEFEDGKVFDYMTRRFLRLTSENEKKQGKHMTGVMYSFRNLDIF